jgi:hypothetical protein
MKSEPPISPALRLFNLIFLGLLIFAGCVRPDQTAAKDDTAAVRLTAELRDGSRVVGQGVDKTFAFHSVLLGNVELAVKDIRSIECVTTNSAKVTTTGGDVLTVGFAQSELKLQTGFGKLELPVNSIRHLTVSVLHAGAKPIDGLVALWSAEGNGNDSVGGNTAMLTDISFANGKTGQAFSFNGTSSSIKIIPHSNALDVGAGAGFTVTAWIKPSEVDGLYPILEWNNGYEWGVHLYICKDGGPGSLYGNIVERVHLSHQVYSSVAPVTTDVFHHVALTYDKASGAAKIYCNGTVVGETNVGSFSPQTSYNLFLGRRPSDESSLFAGLMDEISIYNRALSDDEINSLAEATAPAQPASNH